MSKIKAGVIGAGIGKYHIEGYMAHPDVEIVGLCDLNEEVLAQVGLLYGVEKLYTDYQEMLASDIDCVSVCVPNKFHAPIVIDCLNAGKHVLCEKPLARNAKEGQKMVDAAEAAGKTLMIQFNNRFRPEAQILGFSTDPRTIQQLTMSWGATPMHLDPLASEDDRIDVAIATALEAGEVRSGDLVCVVHGSRHYPGIATDTLRLVAVR